MVQKQYIQKSHFLTKIAASFLVFLCCFCAPRQASANFFGDIQKQLVDGAQITVTEVIPELFSPASLASVFNDIRCFFGFKCAETTTSQEPTTDNQSQTAENQNPTTENPEPQQPESQTTAQPDQPKPPVQITQIINPVKEIQTIHTITNNTNTVVVDNDTKTRVDQLLRQLNSDRPNYSTGQTVSLPTNLVSKTLNITSGDFNVDENGNVTANDITAHGNLTVQGNFAVSGSQTYSGAASFTATSTTPALLVEQTGSGNALQADNVTIKDSTIATNNGGALQFQTANNYLDANGNLVLEGDITAGKYNGLTINPTTKSLTVSNDATISGTNTGDQTIILTGDITGSGTGSFATAIGNSKVTNTMLAGSIAASKLIGTDISTLGTITAGIWNGSIIPVAYGGTGTATGSITGTSSLTFAAGGTNQNVTLTPSGSGYTILNGNVGVATTTPSGTFDVNGAGYFGLLNGVSLFLNHHYDSADVAINFGNVGSGDDYLMLDNYDSNASRFNDEGHTFALSDDLFVSGRIRTSGNSYFDGNVGIGTTGPSQKLEVVQSLVEGAGVYSQVTDVATGRNIKMGVYRPSGISQTYPGIWLNQAAPTDSNYAFLGDTGFTFFNAPSGGQMNFGIGNVYKMVMDSAGNVGIGTTNPSSKLEVTGDIRISNGSGGQIIFADGSTMASAGLGSAAALSNTTDAIVTGDSDANNTGAVILKTGSSDRLHILNGGNVGIGTANPGTKFQVNGQAGTGEIGVANITGYDAYGQSLVMQLPSTGYNGNLIVLMKAAGGSGQAMGFSTHFTSDVVDRFSIMNHSGAEKLTVLDGGNVGIGTTAPGANLHVLSGSADGSSAIVGNSGSGVSQLVIDAANGDGVGADYLLLEQSNDLSATIQTRVNGGNLYLGAKASNILTLSTTGNAYFENNVGIGTTTPSGTFDVNGAGYFGLLNGVSLFLNHHYDSADVAINFGNVGSGDDYLMLDNYDSNASRFNDEGHTFALSDDLFVSGRIRTSGNSYFDGNVGIGTTGTAEKLSVRNASAGINDLLGLQYGALVGDGGNVNFKIEGGAVVGQLQQQMVGSGNYTMRLKQWDGSNLTERITILGNGNAGIGTTVPGAKLEVNGTLRVSDRADFMGASSTNLLRLWETTNNNILDMQMTSGGKMQWNKWDGTTLYTFDTTNGNVGIGTTSPDRTLTINAVSGAINSVGAAISLRRADNPLYGAGIWQGYDANGEFLKFGVGVNADPFAIAQTKMVIQSSGNVGIGTTSPSEALEVVGTIKSSSSTLILGSQHALRTATSAYVQDAIRGSGYIQWGTDIGAIGTNYFVSDERLKNHITAAEESALDKLNSIDFIAFNYNPGVGFDPNIRYKVGLSAQNLQKIEPLWVDTLAKGTDEERLTPDSTQLLVYALKGIKELNADVNSLNFKINSAGLIGATSTIVSAAVDKRGLVDDIKNVLQSLGMALRDGVASLKEIIVDKITSKQIDGQQINSQRVNSQQITANQMCVKDSGNNDICLTGDQLKDLINKAGSSVTINQTYQAPVTPTDNGTTTASGTEP